MIRQKVFVDLAVWKTMEFLENNIFAGEMYDGELLEKILEMDTDFLKTYSARLETILKNIVNKSAEHEWSYKGEREEFEKMAKSVLKKCKTI